MSIGRETVRNPRSTVTQVLEADNLLLSADFELQRRPLAAVRKAAFLIPPTDNESRLALVPRHVGDHRDQNVWSLATLTM